MLLFFSAFFRPGVDRRGLAMCLKVYFSKAKWPASLVYVPPSGAVKLRPTPPTIPKYHRFLEAVSEWGGCQNFNEITNF